MENTNKKLKIGIASAAVTAAVSFAALFGNNIIADADSYVKQEGSNGFTYYANGDKVASLVLQDVDSTTQKAIIFTKNAEGVFNVHSLTVINDGDNKITVTADGDGLEKNYYVGVTNNTSVSDLDKAKEMFDGAVAVSDNSGVYTIKKDSNSIDVQEITIVSDTEPPVISEIVPTTTNYVYGTVTVKVIASDNYDSSENFEYSTNGLTWVDSNEITLSSNDTFTFYVRDVSGNVSEGKSITVSNIITTEDKYDISKSIEHNESTDVGKASYDNYKLVANGGEGAKYYYKSANVLDNLKVDINSVRWTANKYSLDVNSVKQYIGVFVKATDGTVNLQTVERGEAKLKIGGYEVQEFNNKKYVSTVTITTTKNTLPQNLQSNLKGEIENGNVTFSVDESTKLTTITITPKDDKGVNGDLKVSYINAQGLVEYFVVEDVVIDTTPPEIKLFGEYDNTQWHKELYTVDIAVSDDVDLDKLEGYLYIKSTGESFKVIEFTDKNQKDSEGRNIYAVSINTNLYNNSLDAEIRVRATDRAGNKTNYTAICDYKVDSNNPTISSAVVNDLGDYIIKDKEYSVEVKSSDRDSGIDKVELLCGENIITELTYNSISKTYTVETVLSDYLEYVNSSNKMDLKIKVTDKSGRETEKELSSPLAFGSINCIYEEYKLSNNDNIYLNEGESIDISYKFDHEVKIESIKINNNDIKNDIKNITEVPMGGEYYYIISVPFDKISSFVEDAENINIEVNFTDGSGNKYTGENNSIKYYSNFEISDLSIVSSNEKDKVVKKGDTITVSFNTTKAVELGTKTLTIGGKNVSLTSEDNINWTAKYKVTGKEGWSDTQSLPINIKISDIADNSQEVNDTSVNYYKPLDIEDRTISIKAENDKNTVINGDNVIVSFALNHKAESVIFVIGDKELEAESQDGINWTVKYTVSGEDLKDESLLYYFDNKLNITIKAKDIAGNEYTAVKEDFSQTETVRYYQPVYINDTIKLTPGIVKIEDKITIVFSADGDADKAEVIINGEKIEATPTNSEKTKWKLVYTIPSNNTFEDLKEIPVTINIEDKAGNKDTKTIINSGVIYYDEIKINNIKVESDNESGNKNIAKDNDTITLSFTANHILTSAKVIIDGQTFSAVSDDGENWSLQYKIPQNNSFIDTENIVISSIVLGDTAGNSLTENNIESTVAYYEPIQINNIKVESNNNNTTVAKNKDKIIVTFDTNHNTQIESVLFGNTESLENITADSMTSERNDDGSYRWTVQYTVPEDNSLIDLSKIALKINVKDNALNKADFTENNSVKYYAPININNVVISSNNESENKSLAKDGDIITVTFDANHSVKIDKAEIAGQSANATSDSLSKQWTLKYKLSNGDINTDNSKINSTIIVTDEAGNTFTYSRNTGSDNNNSVVYYKPLSDSIKNITMTTSEEGTNINNGDVLYWSFNSTHPINTSNTYINADGKDIYFTLVSNDNSIYYYQASYTVPSVNTLSDVDVINYNLYINDSAVNATFNSTQEATTKFTYYAPITVKNVAINTNNVNNGSLYAKDGDTITVSFITNHYVTIDTQNIAGANALVSYTTVEGSQNETAYTLRYTVSENTLQDLSQISFAFTAIDSAGNTINPITNNSEGVTNKITYYAPITATADISSDISNSSFVKNGGKVTVSFKTNHSASVSSGTIGGRTASPSASNTDTPYMTYIIPSSESNLSQGGIAFEANITDPAGNIVKISNTEGSIVIYDREKPTIVIEPDLSSFVNEEITYTVTISDVNIEANNIVIAVIKDGEETLYPVYYSDIAGSGGKSVSKTITLSDDAEYVIEVRATDKADNAADSRTVRVTVDTTNPEIKVTNIDLNKPKTYKAGQVLSDFFSIDEPYINDIICTVTDSKGNVQEWSLDKPITDDMDGRQTFTLQVTDSAGNTSKVITYDFYIDNTAPKIVISDELTSKLINSMTSDTFVSGMKLNISLEDLHIGDNGLDKFTTVKLIKPDKTEVNLLGTDPTQAIVFDLNADEFEDGEYTLVLNAIDDMGNETGEVTYTFEFKDKTIFAKFYDNKGLFYTSAAIAAILIILGVVIIVRKKKRDNN